MINTDEIKKYLNEIADFNAKEYFLKKEREELLKLGIIAGAAGALTITAAILIAKKLRKKRNTQVIEIQPDNIKKED